MEGQGSKEARRRRRVTKEGDGAGEGSAKMVSSCHSRAFSKSVESIRRCRIGYDPIRKGEGSDKGFVVDHPPYHLFYPSCDGAATHPSSPARSLADSSLPPTRRQPFVPRRLSQINAAAPQLSSPHHTSSQLVAFAHCLLPPLIYPQSDRIRYNGKNCRYRIRSDSTKYVWIGYENRLYPIRSVCSPISDPNSEPPKFCNARSQRYYDKLLERKVHSERKLDIPDHLKDFVEDFINHYQWQFLYNEPVEINETLLREFYGNYHAADLQTIFLRQHDIDISEKAIADYMKIQVVPKTKEVYEKAISDKDMGRLNWEKILKRIVTHVANYVMPSTHELSITANVAILIWLILERKTVNLPPLIRNSIFKVRVPWESQDVIYRVPNNKRSLPHGNWYKGDKAQKRKRKRSGAGTSTDPLPHLNNRNISISLPKWLPRS
ncbi:hypothetical protein PIB30_020187 [Stylosanthes scabra]|uniref:Putative plant transposon protein domain-containing protein n=1 Tax=Stylosanthes scabra TaxID=79078 RepID=A0ABU6Q8B3_9FABA|nr:hypothetical protein [Stylosanthes scabra]